MMRRAMRRTLLVCASGVSLVVLMVVPVLAWSSPGSEVTTDTSALGTTISVITSDTNEPGSGTTDAGTTSTTFTVTVEPQDAETYQLALLGSDLDFAVSASGQSAQSQAPLSIVNTGTAPFGVFVGADMAPADAGGHQLRFSDSPQHDEVCWSLSTTADIAGGVAISDSSAAGFGVLEPGRSLVLYSYLRLGSGLDYPGVYSWTGTVYAVPTA